MIQNNTLFKKYIITNITSLFISFFILGIMMLVFVSNYWVNEKKVLLEETACTISRFINKNMDNNDLNLYEFQSQLKPGFLNAVSPNLESDIFISDSNGTIILSSAEHKDDIKAGQQVPNQILIPTLHSEYETTDFIINIGPQKYYIVSFPIAGTIQSQEPVGAVFAAIDASYIINFRINMLKIFLIAASISLVISIILSSIASYKMSKPLKQMAQVAICFGKGDFSKRVPVITSDEIGILSHEFNNMAESLSLSEDSRRSFVANVSHELKTPITTIGGFIDGILDQTIPQDKQNYYLNIVSKEIKRLSRLVASMLNLSRIDSGNIYLNKQTFDITEVILSIMISFEPQIEKKSVDILGLSDIDKIYIYGDHDLIHQAIYNIIENAVKFSDNGGYISIQAIQDSKNITIKIKNSGIGISPKEIAHIFDKFYKTDKSRSKDKTGIGLGLYIVKKILTIHDGNISVQSEQGHYCEFTINIPNPK